MWTLLHYLESPSPVLFSSNAPPPPLQYNQQQMTIISFMAMALDRTQRLANPNPKQFSPQTPNPLPLGQFQPIFWNTWGTTPSNQFSKPRNLEVIPDSSICPNSHWTTNSTIQICLHPLLPPIFRCSSLSPKPWQRAFILCPCLVETPCTSPPPALPSLHPARGQWTFYDIHLTSTLNKYLFDICHFLALYWMLGTERSEGKIDLLMLFRAYWDGRHKKMSISYSENADVEINTELF